MHQIEFPKILAEFGLRPTGDPKLLEGGEDNGNFRIATDKGEVVVREYGVRHVVVLDPDGNSLSLAEAPAEAE